LVTDVSWIFLDTTSNTFVRLTCVRAIRGTKVGQPRLNIQEVTVPTTTQSSGFCETGVIGQKSDAESARDVHDKCTLSAPTALNACKNLVNQALTERDLAQCAQQFCAVSEVNYTSCLQVLGDGTSDAAWLTEYCSAVFNLGATNVQTCKKMVTAQGYPWAVDAYGNGHKNTGPDSRGCGVSLAEYTLDQQPTCEDGVYIDVKIKGEWVPKFFIPVSKPPCNGELIITGDNPLANPLFSNSIRLRQCDVKANPMCNAVSPCSETIAIDFSVSFNNIPRQLLQLYNNNLIVCVPQEGTGSTTWCLPDSTDYTPVDQVCPGPCPTTAPTSGRLL